MRDCSCSSLILCTTIDDHDKQFWFRKSSCYEWIYISHSPSPFLAPPAGLPGHWRDTTLQQSDTCWWRRNCRGWGCERSPSSFSHAQPMWRPTRRLSAEPASGSPQCAAAPEGNRSYTLTTLCVDMVQFRSKALIPLCVNPTLLRSWMRVFKLSNTSARSSSFSGCGYRWQW